MELSEEVRNAYSIHKLCDKNMDNIQKNLLKSFEVYNLKEFEKKLRSTSIKIKTVYIPIHNNPLTEDQENELQNIINMYIEYKVKYLIRTYGNANKCMNERSEKNVELDEAMIKSIIYLNYKSKVELEKRKCHKFLLKIEDIPFNSLSITQKPVIVTKPKVKEEVEICRCPAITLKGLICGAKLKGGNEFCLRHLNK